MSSKHVHIHPCQALMTIDARNARLLTFQGPRGHHHAITLDDALAHLHNMRFRVCMDVDPSDLIAGKGQECIACRPKNSGKRRHRPKQLPHLQRIIGLHKHITGEEPFALLFPGAVFTPHDLAAGDKTILHNAPSKLRNHAGSLSLLAADHLNNVNAHGTSYLSAWLRQYSLTHELASPYKSDTYSNPQPLFRNAHSATITGNRDM